MSATIISVYAADSQQTTTITYEAPASAEENIYEILIPSSMEILHNENSKAIYVEIADNYHLTPSYVVHVDLSPSSFNDDSSVTERINTYVCIIQLIVITIIHYPQQILHLIHFFIVLTVTHPLK